MPAASLDPGVAVSRAIELSATSFLYPTLFSPTAKAASGVARTAGAAAASAAPPVERVVDLRLAQAVVVVAVEGRRRLEVVDAVQRGRVREVARRDGREVRSTSSFM